MAQSKHQYYHTGSDTQKKADITIDLKRPDARKMTKWTREQLKDLPEFIRMAEGTFRAFIKELKKYTNNGTTDK